MGKVVTLGEIMLRLSTPGNTRFVQSDSFDVVYGGGEANVAVSCANYGHEAYFVTKLPKHEIGQSAVNALRKYGVSSGRSISREAAVSRSEWPTTRMATICRKRSGG